MAIILPDLRKTFDGTTSHSTKRANNARQVAGYVRAPGRGVPPQFKVLLHSAEQIIRRNRKHSALRELKLRPLRTGMLEHATQRRRTNEFIEVSLCTGLSKELLCAYRWFIGGPHESTRSHHRHRCRRANRLRCSVPYRQWQHAWARAADHPATAGCAAGTTNVARRDDGAGGLRLPAAATNHHHR